MHHQPQSAPRFDERAQDVDEGLGAFQDSLQSFLPEPVTPQEPVRGRTVDRPAGVMGGMDTWADRTVWILLAVSVLMILAGMVYVSVQ